MEIAAINVNDLFVEGLWRFKTCGVLNQTRNGEVYRIDEPVLTKIQNPTERVLFHGGRDANPIFHLMESIWILAGRNDVAFLQNFNSNIGQFSDDGVRFNAPYGHRMRRQFGFDQLKEIIDLIKHTPNTRQAVMQLWDTSDFNKSTLDKACNTSVMFSVVDGKLDMMITNRSNDFWWGYCGANPVHFSIIQEFVAIALGIPVGMYYTVSNNLHLYTKLYNALPLMLQPPTSSEDFDYYSTGAVQPMDLYYDDWESFLEECEVFCEAPLAYYDYKHEFFRHVARPMAYVSYDRKNKISDGTVYANQIMASDWKTAVQQWIMRRESK
jgi:thymidylate synthase